MSAAETIVDAAIAEDLVHPHARAKFVQLGERHGEASLTGLLTSMRAARIPDTTARAFLEMRGERRPTRAQVDGAKAEILAIRAGAAARAGAR